jgi:autoinducer 2 (AI-2) kinase
MEAAMPGSTEQKREAGSRPRILVTADMSEDALAALRALGEVEYASFRQLMRLLSGPALVEALAGAQVFITEVDIVDADALSKLPELRVVAACRGQAVNVDLAACTAFGVPVLYAPGRNADAVADLTVAFLLMLARKLPQATAFLHQPDIEAGDLGRMGQAFTTLQGHELWRHTVGLVGFGAVGRGVARRLAGFGVRIVVHDPHVPEQTLKAAGGEPVTLDELLAQSDFVSLHAAVSDETKAMLGAAELARMKRGAFLVNTARAALVDQEALAEALRTGQLGGAALDVFPVEPPGSDDPLLALDTVIATPHVGGNTVEVATHQGEIIAADLRRVLAGERPSTCSTPTCCAASTGTGRAGRCETLEALAARPAPAVSHPARSMPPARAKAPAAPAASAAAGPAPVPPEIAERMGRILRGFVGRLARDASLEAFAADKDVTLHFTLTDLGQAFYLRLRKGEVQADLGEPDAPAHVELSMRAEILDGMFTGTVNAMQAATGGRLSFRGDTMKAMTLQHVQADLSRLYAEARAEVGGPGDLASIPDPAAARRAAIVRPVTPGDIREELVQVMNELYAAQLITATGGNVSVRIPGRDEVWITPGQLFKGHLRPEMLVRLDLDGNPLDAGALSPSSERLMHCSIYKVRSDAGAVIHAHAPNATILADTGIPFLPISTEAAFFGDIPRVPFIMPGTEELAEKVADGARQNWAVLMENHGLIVAGRSLRRAADMVEIIERTAEIIIACHALGKKPSLLPDEVVQMLQKMGDLMA